MPRDEKTERVSVAQSERLAREESLEDFERKQVLEAIGLRCHLLNEELAIFEVIMSPPSVWREKGHYKPQVLDVAWDFTRDEQGALEKVELDINTRNPQRDFLCADFSGKDGSIITVRFSDPQLGNLTLLYEEGRLVEANDLPEKTATDSWQEALCKGRLDVFLTDFCNHLGIPIPTLRSR